MVRVTPLTVFFLLASVGCGPAVVASEGSSSGEAEASSGVPGSESSTPPQSTSANPATSSPPMTATSSPPDTTTSASSASASDSTSTGSDDSGSTWAFITDPPCTGEPCSYTCDPWEQDCPEGEACKPWSDDGGNAWNSTRCTPLSPDPAQVGDPCTLEGPGLSGFDDCDIGSTCYHLDEALEGTCVELCDGTEQDPFCADPDRICTISNEGALTLCLIACNPSADECPPQFECQPYEDGGVCVLPSGAGG